MEGHPGTGDHQFLGRLADIEERIGDAGWRNVGDEDQVPFENGWASLGSPYPPVGFRREGSRVWLRGSLDSTNATDFVIFTLPDAYRPEHQSDHTLALESSLAPITITPEGEVQLGGSFQSLNLGTISFPVNG